MKILLAEIMNVRKLSLRKVSALTGVPKSTLDDIVNHRTSTTKMETLEKIAAGLHIKLTDLVKFGE